jgi:hypothetical protein
MAVLEKAPNYSIQHEIVCKRHAVTYNTGVLYDYFKDSNHFLHSQISSFEIDDNIFTIQQESSDENRIFIKLKNKVFSELEDKGISNNKLEEVNSVIAQLSRLKVTAINASVTYDNSIFYSFRKHNTLYHLEHFLDYEGDTDDIEFSLAYKISNEYISIGGSKHQIFTDLNRII